jgi:GNAT superfamily N-acetyltransferase
MAATDDVDIVGLGVADAPDGLVLSAEAHWNQNEADWRFFLTEGVTFGVRDKARLVATAALLPYAAGNAWISMVLVTADFRRRGIATKLVDACLDAASQRGLTAWLDATTAGATVYGPLGFAPTLELRRLQLAAATARPSPPPPATGDLETLIARDALVMGFERRALLSEFAARPGTRIVAVDGAIALVRDGRTARHIGPVIADRADPALKLVEAVAGSEPGLLVIDAGFSQSEFLDGLVRSGWTIERPFLRMRFGAATTSPTRQPFAAAGPEFG